MLHRDLDYRSPTHKKNMWHVFRTQSVPFLLIIIFTFCLFLSYRDRSKWQETTETLQNLINMVVEQNELISQIILTNERIQKGLKEYKEYDKNAPTIFAITPTYKRPVQKAELTRLAQTFLHVVNFHWIIVEDSVEKTELVRNFLKESGLVYTHLNAVTPMTYKLGNNDPHWKKPRGIAQRNAALDWIRQHVSYDTRGVVYFADDDNVYAIKLFKEMAKINVIGVWPVGLVGGLMVERPICDNATKKVVSFNAAWKPERKYPLDMAGFALNLKVVLDKKNASFSYAAKGGYQETMLLEQMVTRDQLEPLADCCTKVYVWHTRTEPTPLHDEEKLKRKGERSDLNIEV